MANGSIHVALNEYSPTEVFVINSITTWCFVPKFFWVLFRRHIQALYRLKDPSFHLRDNVAWEAGRQKIMNHFTIPGQSFFLRAPIRFWKSVAKTSRRHCRIVHEKCKCHIEALWIKIVWHARLNFDRKYIVEGISNEFKMVIFICTRSRFANYETFLAAWPSYFNDSPARREV